MNIDGFGFKEMKNKIRSIQITYSQVKTKIDLSKKSGIGADEIYKSSLSVFCWEFFVEMYRWKKNVFQYDKLR